MTPIPSAALAHVHGGTTINIDLGSLVQQIAALLQQQQQPAGSATSAQPGPDPSAQRTAQQGAPQAGGAGGFDIGSLLQMFGGLTAGGTGGTGGTGGGAGGQGGAGAALGG